MNFNNDISIDYASKLSRFLGFMLDNFILIILYISSTLLYGDWYQEIVGNSFLANFGFFLLGYFLYHFLFELAFSWTPGKFLTLTRVINEYGYKPSFKALLIRNACRFIPFDHLSFLFAEKGWHDAISKTTVANL
ncbi:RDD family protein [Flavobacterium buctense]|uniref:RDD family protein n=1 Tax=Flavobacterium buctense TaxID=1648146 RepID=A0ABU9DZV5_9FLAO|nr:RDD family protein [Flavobacterium buctense]